MKREDGSCASCVACPKSLLEKVVEDATEEGNQDVAVGYTWEHVTMSLIPSSYGDGFCMMHRS